MNNIQFQFKLTSAQSITQDLDILHTLGLVFLTKAGNKTIVRTEWATFTVFSSGYVGVCAVRNEGEMAHALKDFCDLCEVSESWSDLWSTVKINNICFHGQIRRGDFREKFISLLSKVCEKHKCKLSMNTRRFSGVNLNTPYANLTCFDSGAVNVTGVRSLWSFECHVLPLIEDLMYHEC